MDIKKTQIICWRKKHNGQVTPKAKCDKVDHITKKQRNI